MADKETKVAVTGPPKEAPKSFTMTGAYTRETLVLTLAWDYPASAKGKKSANRWKGLVLHLSVDRNLTPNDVVKQISWKETTKGFSKWKSAKKNKKANAKKNIKVNKKKDTKKVSSQTVDTKTISTVTLENKVIKENVKATSYKVSIDLNAYHPNVGGTPKLDAVIAKLQGYNKFSLPKSKGFNTKIPWALYQVKLANPDTPAVERNYINEARKINYKCVASQPGSGKHWYWTEYEFIATRYHWNPKTRVNEGYIGNRINDTGRQTVLEFNKAFALAQNDLTDMNTKIVVSFTARAYGAHGVSGSGTADAWTFAYPHQKAIGKVAIAGDLVVIPFSNDPTVVNVNRYTSTVWLERLPDFMVPERLLLTADDDVWKAQAARSSGWEKVGGEFDPSVGKFVRNANMDRAGISSPYSRTLYRVGAKNESFDIDDYYIYSYPAFYPEYKEIPKPTNDVVDFLECVPEKNGTSVRVVIAYHVDYANNGEDPTSDGCEVSWSDDYNSWKSNNPPATFDMPDLDNLGQELFRVKKPVDTTPISDDMYSYWLIPDDWDNSKKNEKYHRLTDAKDSGGKGFMYVSKGYIMGLSEGTKYYFRARRYLEETSDLPRLYGPYADYSSNLGYEDEASAAKLVKPSTTPTNVKLKVTSPVPVEKDLELIWTFEGDGTQTEWELKRYTASEVVEVESTEQANAKVWKLSDTAVGISVKSSKDAAGYTLLPYYTSYNDDGSVKELGVSEYLEDNMVYFVIATKTTGDFGYSAPVQVQYVEPPVASLGVPSIVTEQPVCLSIGSNTQDCSAVLKITAIDSTTRQSPDGLHTQSSGHVVYSNRFEASSLHWRPYAGPVAPSSQDTSGWFDEPPTYDEHYPDYYRSYRYVESGTVKWTAPEHDKPLSELKLLGEAASEPVLMWYAGTLDDVPFVPMPVDTEQNGYSEMNPSEMGWCEKQGVEDNRYYEATADTEVVNAHVYYEMCGAESVSTSHSVWTSVLPEYDSEYPVYYYCYKYKIATYDGYDRYAWTEVAVDTGMGELMASGISQQNIVSYWNCEPSLSYFSNIMLPRPLELLDGARYQVSLVLEDPATKLDSKAVDVNGLLSPMLEEFTVSYARSASAPNPGHVLIFSDKDSLAVSIQIAYPELHHPGDVYDVYRVTPDGIVRIGSDISPGQTVQDLYAPFSSDRVSFSNPDEKAVNLRYRVALRTPDGSEAWRDVLYSLKNPSIRFDWGGANAHLMEHTSLTIPYNLTYSDTFRKYFEARHHMNDRLPVGFWATSLDRTSSISTDIIKYDSPSDKEALKSLASHAGPVFVRRPDGCAYLANVELNSYAVSYNASVVPVSFDVTEIELTPEYMIADGSYLLDEDKIALDALSTAPNGFYDTLLLEMKTQ